MQEPAATEYAAPAVVVEKEAVQGILGYRFGDPSLLDEALTHGSYYYPLRNGVTYERLEFVGDAVLNCIVAAHLFRRYPNMEPGMLTLLRAANVDTEKLARVAAEHGLHKHLGHKNPSIDSQMEEFMRDIKKFPIHSNGLIDVPKILADIVESLIGAIFIDSKRSLDITWKIFEGLAKPFIDTTTLQRHPVSELYELCQKNGKKIKFEDKWKENSEVSVFIDGNLIASSIYKPKKEIAHNRAAKEALNKLKENISSSESSLDIHEFLLEVEEMEEILVDKEVVQITLGYHFNEVTLLDESLTHRSYYHSSTNGPFYERLEFLGDAILNCLVALELFECYPNTAPGQLTLLRAANVDTEKLARIAAKHDLYKHVRHKKPLYDSQMKEFIKDIQKYPNHSNGLVEIPKVYADIVESLIGAIFVDSRSSLETVLKVFKRLAEPLINTSTLGRHPISELNELCQKNGKILKFKDTWNENHEIGVLIDGKLVASVIYAHKKEIAQNRAAKKALNKFNKNIESFQSLTSVQCCLVGFRINDNHKAPDFDGPPYATMDVVSM